MTPFLYPGQTGEQRLRTKSERKPIHLSNTSKAFVYAVLQSYYIFRWYNGRNNWRNN